MNKSFSCVILCSEKEIIHPPIIRPLIDSLCVSCVSVKQENSHDVVVGHNIMPCGRIDLDDVEDPSSMLRYFTLEMLVSLDAGGVPWMCKE